MHLFYLHHFQFVWVGQITAGWFVIQYIRLQVEMGAENKSLLNVLQQLKADLAKGFQ